MTVIGERHKWIAENCGSSFEFSISRILTQGKSEIRNWAKRRVIGSLQWIRWTLTRDWHRESRSKMWNVSLSKLHLHDENILYALGCIQNVVLFKMAYDNQISDFPPLRKIRCGWIHGDPNTFWKFFFWAMPQCENDQTSMKTALPEKKL